MFTLSIAECTQGEVRLLVGQDYYYYEGLTDYDDAYYIDRQLSRGRVEVCINGSWNQVCSETWNNRAASLVCQQLGFSPNGEKS